MQQCIVLILIVFLLAATCWCRSGRRKTSGGGSSQVGAGSTLSCVAPKEKRLVEHRLTSVDETGFVGSAVRAYIRALRDNQSPSAAVLPPVEFNAVVDAGKDAVPFLLHQLSSGDPDIKVAAAIALQRITNELFFDYSDMQTNDKGSNTRAWGKVSSQYGEWWSKNRNLSRVQWLIDDIFSPDIAQRRRAILELSEYDTVDSRTALVKCLTDPIVQIDAATSLARLGDRRSIPALVAVLLPQDSPSVRWQGICLLKSLTGQTLGFEPNAPASSRAEAIGRWKLWIQQNYRSPQ